LNLAGNLNGNLANLVGNNNLAGLAGNLAGNSLAGLAGNLQGNLAGLAGNFNANLASLAANQNHQSLAGLAGNLQGNILNQQIAMMRAGMAGNNSSNFGVNNLLGIQQNNNGSSNIQQFLMQQQLQQQVQMLTGQNQNNVLQQATQVANLQAALKNAQNQNAGLLAAQNNRSNSQNSQNSQIGAQNLQTGARNLQTGAQNLQAGAQNPGVQRNLSYPIDSQPSQPTTSQPIPQPSTVPQNLQTSPNSSSGTTVTTASETNGVDMSNNNNPLALLANLNKLNPALQSSLMAAMIKSQQAVQNQQATQNQQAAQNQQQTPQIHQNLTSLPSTDSTGQPSQAALLASQILQNQQNQQNKQIVVPRAPTPTDETCEVKIDEEEDKWR